MRNCFRKMDKFTLVGIIFLALCIFGMGWFGNELYKSYSNKSTFQGLRFELNNNWTDAVNYAQSNDKYGDWVCVNIKGIDYKRAIEICEHETAHELFSRECSENINRCIDAIT